ncbi:MAG: formylglycine-generating enzyme family protein [Fibromonadales bacterium]|nr:formylglycine-generating enzyme family protein [Fibromonadales bacterium]
MAKSLIILLILSCFAFAQGEIEAAKKKAEAKKAEAEDAIKYAEEIKAEKKPRACTSTCEVKWKESQRKNIAAANAIAAIKKADAEAAERAVKEAENAMLYAKEIAAKKTADSIAAARKDLEEAIAKMTPEEQAKRIADSAAAAQEELRKATAEYNPEMVFIKGSNFFSMGCTKEQGAECNEDERPAHNVTLRDFYASKYPVTQRLWEKVMGSNPSRFQGENLPVESVSWNDVQEFIKKLNAATGKKYRLLTEAEWEYAARGGGSSKGQRYAGSNNLGAVAWYGGNSGQTTRPVGEKQPNELGLYDMSGNVWEWVQNWKDSYYSSGLQNNPVGPGSGTNRVYRGGSWQDNDIYCRVSRRHGAVPDTRSSAVGFRLALDR